jgi:MFS family permease
MERINWGRVILGGLVAGLVMNLGEFILNGVLLAKTVEESLGKISLPPPDGTFIAKAVALTFVAGIVAVLIYAAMRPRLNSKAAITAGLVVWFLIFVYSGLLNNAMGIFPMNITLIGVAWGLVETIIAVYAGAWFYKEADELNALQERRA